MVLSLQSQAEVGHKNIPSVFLKASPTNMLLQAIAHFTYVLNQAC